MIEQQVDDLLELLLVQRVEHDDVVDAVQKLGLEGVAQLVEQALFEVLVTWLVAAVGAEAELLLADRAAAHVARHDDHRVLEVDRAPLTVGQAPVV